MISRANARGQFTVAINVYANDAQDAADYDNDDNNVLWHNWAEATYKSNRKGHARNKCSKQSLYTYNKSMCCA